jgi:8-oxo-dGTP pyrophosphatase MutT (NUDIX family)
MTDIKIVPFERFDFRFTPRPWPYAEARRDEIDAHFAARRRDRPALWNGRVLVACEHAVQGGLCRGAFLETDFASFDAWRQWGAPAAADVFDCFAASALMSSDGAFMLGVMGAHTANAGQIYFPCGTPDPSDVADGRVDLERNAFRELKEETGLDIGELDDVPGWFAVLDGTLIMHVKRLRAREPAVALRRRLLDHLARERQPELSDIRIVRGPADLDPMIPTFTAAFLAHQWSGA